MPSTDGSQAQTRLYDLPPWVALVILSLVLAAATVAFSGALYLEFRGWSPPLGEPKVLLSPPRP